MKEVEDDHEEKPRFICIPVGWEDAEMGFADGLIWMRTTWDQSVKCNPNGGKRFPEFFLIRGHSLNAQNGRHSEGRGNKA